MAGSRLFGSSAFMRPVSASSRICSKRSQMRAAQPSAYEWRKRRRSSPGTSAASLFASRSTACNQIACHLEGCYSVGPAAHNDHVVAPGEALREVQVGNLGVEISLPDA